ncbi:PaaI family thioesterase [Pedobacter sp. MC2016-24]|uniref:PaaI family thioesterase n=1 Tax=Pedobacter sp. MC2016-24 TaxID=2780090 RepID=UPI001882B1E2|nr:PaaI family thioesterase [Pedobacter sp. MC2016-24]MBE9597815.1 PaaI family thioesterase [Pedobacter sp. MC2016-24]
METLERLALLQKFIGKEFSVSPSPFMRWLKPVVVIAEAGHLEFSYLIRNEMTNPLGILHGGITAAIIDDLIGATLFTLSERESYVTLNNVIDYFASAKEGEHIIAETQIIKKGSQIVNMQCEVWNERKTKLIAKGYSNMFKTADKK